MKNFQELNNDPKKEKKALQALFDDPKQFDALSNAQKISVMQDYLFLCALDHFDLHKEPGKAFAMHQDMEQDTQLSELLSMLLRKIPDGKLLRQELENPQMSFFASEAVSDDIISAKKVISKEMKAYRQALEQDGLEGVHQMRDAEQNALRAEKQKAAEHIYQQEQLERDIQKKELLEAEAAFRAHQEDIERTRKKGQVIAGAKDFDRKAFKAAAYRNGWNKATDAEVLDAIYDIYAEARGVNDGRVDLAAVKQMEDVMNNIMTMKGDIESRYQTAFAEVSNSAGYFEGKNPSVFAAFDDCVSEQQERFAEQKQREQEQKQREQEQKERAAQQAPKPAVRVSPRPVPVQHANRPDRSDLKAYQELSRGLHTSKWYMAGHKDSAEITKLKEASDALAEALSKNSVMTMSKLRQAYEASLKYQEKIRFAHNVPYDNKTWKPNTGFGKDRYKAAKEIEAFAKKYLPEAEIKQHEKQARHNDYMHRTMVKASEYTPDNVESKMMKEAQNALSKQVKKLDSNQSAAPCAAQIAQVLAVHYTSRYYASQGGQKDKKTEPVDFIRFVDSARKQIMKRPEFAHMVRLMTPEEAAQCAAAKNAQRLSMKLSDAKSMLETFNHTAENARARSLTVTKDHQLSAEAGPKNLD